jgi:uncharacterized OsmC-like protein
MQPPRNALGDDPRPRFFLVDDEPLPLHPPPPRLGQSVRVAGRSLAGMQKEALVVDSLSGRCWRLVSDEGPELNGHDEAPFPLAFLTAGLLASYATEIAALGAQRGLDVAGIRLTVASRYTMTGSSLRGTMVGGALRPELTVTGLPAGAGRLVAEAVAGAAVTGLVRGTAEGLFTLSSNGRPVDTGRVARFPGPAEPDPRDAFEAAGTPAPGTRQPLVRRTAPSGFSVGGDPTAVPADQPGRGFAAVQDRTLLVHGTCVVREDGVKDLELSLVRPAGATFRMLSDEAEGFGGTGRAPSAVAYVAAGLAFCFMTQLGRYATITRKQLDGYRVVQDMHFTLGGASGSTGRAGGAAAVETHVHLETPEDDDFARVVVDMGEQTCFLHALCRTGLTTKVQVTAE